MPLDPSDVGESLMVIVGPVNGPGEESFQLTVWTPRWLQREVDSSGPLVGRHYVIVSSWDWPTIEDFLRRAFEREEADDWAALGERLGRIGFWEFEDYRA